MKTIRQTIALVLLFTAISMSAQTAKSRIKAYYFHFTARCVTCQTVEAEARKNLKDLAGKDVVLQSVNLDEPAGEALAKKLDVSTQTLLLVNGAKKINITNEGFMYARSNPAKFRAVMQKKIAELNK